MQRTRVLWWQFPSCLSSWQRVYTSVLLAFYPNCRGRGEGGRSPDGWTKSNWSVEGFKVRVPESVQLISATSQLKMARIHVISREIFPSPNFSGLNCTGAPSPRSEIAFRSFKFVASVALQSQKKSHTLILLFICPIIISQSRRLQSTFCGRPKRVYLLLLMAYFWNN